MYLYSAKTLSVSLSSAPKRNQPFASRRDPFLPGFMSGKQPISIDEKDSEHYAELLRNTSRLANRCLPSDERQDVDSPLDRHLPVTLLDVLADISLCQRRNVSATMASLKDDNGTLETRLYIVFNHEDDETAHRCPRHLASRDHL